MVPAVLIPAIFVVFVVPIPAVFAVFAVPAALIPAVFVSTRGSSSFSSSSEFYVVPELQKMQKPHKTALEL